MLLAELGYPQDSPTVLHSDNQGSITLMSHLANHQCMKHINVHYHFTRECVESKELVLKWVPTRRMITDVLTKGLDGVLHRELMGKVGLADVLHEGEC
jgi:hypothetical protein